MLQVDKLGIKVSYDENNLSDAFSEKNVVYLLTFPDDKRYIGSTMDLTTRINTHCSNSKSLPLLREHIDMYKEFKVTKLASFDCIEDARKCEDRLIKEYHPSGILLNVKNGR